MSSIPDDYWDLLHKSDEPLRVVVAGREGRYTLGAMCSRGLRANGHEVTFVDISTRTIPIVGISVGVSAGINRLVGTVQRVSPDVVLIIKGEDIDRSAVRRVKSATNGVVCNWNPDNPFMSRSTERRMETYLDALNVYDAVFIWSEELFEPLHEEGAQEVYHLPFAYDPEIHYPTEPSPEYETDVVFLGHWSEKRQRHMATLADAEFELSIYGNYWGRKCFNRKIRNSVRGSAVFGEDYCQAMCSAAVVVNVVADHNLDAYNMRSFEIPATGSLMITTRTQRQQEIFGENGGIACYDSPEELRDQVAFYLQRETERQETAKSGAHQVQPHTYKERMRNLVSFLWEMSHLGD